ncbi:unnamed protein product [Caenorhabditis brenneri]
MSCTYRNSILESDEFMRISYHSLSVIQVPLHALGFYIVIWKTPREMTSVKFSMLALHSACAFWDISWSILTIPVVFFPIVSGYPLGLLSYFGTPALFQTYLVFAGVYHSQTARIISHQKLPCVPSRILDDPRMFMLSADPYDFHLYFALEMCSTAFQAIAFLIGTLNYLSKTKSLSKRTLQLQKQFFKCLCLQAMIPIVAIICPGIYIVYTAFTGNFDLVLEFDSLKSMSCTYRNSIFESDGFMQISYHSLSVIQVPLHILGFYIVIWKTPRAMVNVKFSMIALHIVSAWCDICLTVLTMPVVFFPAHSGYPLGVLYDLGVPMWLQTYIMLTAVFLIASGLILFFEDRYNRLVRPDANQKSRKVKRLIHHSVNLLISVTLVIPTLILIPDQQKARTQYHQILPCVPSRILDDPKMFMLSDNPKGLAPYYLFELLYAVIQIFAFFIGSLRHLSETKTFSARTLQLQKQFFKCLSLQVAIPLVTISIPAGYIIASEFGGDIDVVLCNISILWFSTHGLSSTVAMLMVHKPYREATISLFRPSGRFFGRSESKAVFKVSHVSIL